MSAVIIAKGKPSLKTVFGEKKWVTPVVVAYGEGKDLDSFGVGFFYGRKTRGKGSVWGLFTPYALLQSWRGMKILEGVKVIGSATLCACWTSGRLNMREDRYQQYVVGDLVALNGERVGLGARERAFQGAPSRKNWEAMLRRCKKRGLKLATFDIRAEVEAGYLKGGSSLKRLLPTSESYRAMRRRKATRAKEQQTLPPVPEVVGRMELQIEVPATVPKRAGIFARFFGRKAA